MVFVPFLQHSFLIHSYSAFSCHSEDIHFEFFVFSELVFCSLCYSLFPFVLCLFRPLSFTLKALPNVWWSLAMHQIQNTVRTIWAKGRRGDATGCGQDTTRGAEGCLKCRHQAVSTSSGHRHTAWVWAQVPPAEGQCPCPRRCWKEMFLNANKPDFSDLVPAGSFPFCLD